MLRSCFVSMLDRVGDQKRTIKYQMLYKIYQINSNSCGFVPMLTGEEFGRSISSYEKSVRAGKFGFGIPDAPYGMGKAWNVTAGHLWWPSAHATGWRNAQSKPGGFVGRMHRHRRRVK